MTLMSIFFIAIGVSMDAFAVSITNGLTLKRHYFRTAIIFGLFFGGFQALMPILGWTAGSLLKGIPITEWDHWIAFTLLALIGGKMVWNSRANNAKTTIGRIDLLVMLGLSIATSIDALAVGISLTFLQVNIIFTAILIGCTTFIFSFLGILIGKSTGGYLTNKAELFGGLVLIGIGLKILLEHIA
jgi:putative Mn2+ efflux pump MntP